jgi:exonuclease VII small subunit
MNNIKVKDLENFIEVIENEIEQLDKSIKHLMFKGKVYRLSIEILKKEREEIEKQLNEFKEKTLGELLQGDIKDFNKLISYREIINGEIKIGE